MTESRARRSGTGIGARRAAGGLRPWERTRRRPPPAVLALALAACGSPSPPADHASALREEAVVSAGDVRVRASLFPTGSLNETVARGYGINRDPRTVLLLAGVRRGPELHETALPARITATATDLRGVRRSIAMREVRSGDFVDYIGTLQVTPPDTLRIEIDLEHAGGAPTHLAFSRDLYP